MPSTRVLAAKGDADARRRRGPSQRETTHVAAPSSGRGPRMARSVSCETGGSCREWSLSKVLIAKCLVSLGP